MPACAKCGASAAAHDFSLLEVQTLRIRDIAGERRVQALGLFDRRGVCRDCARAHLAGILRPWRAMGRRLLPSSAVLLLGVLICVFLHRSARPLLVMGAAGILCGVLGIASTLRTAEKRRAAFAALPPQEAERQAAWACLLEVLPKKDGENDLTYIPLDERTMEMKNGDLMLAYDLLPAVAVKAWELIHREDRTGE